MHPHEEPLADETAEAAIDLLGALTAISSASADETGLERMAARLARELGERGFAVEIVPEPGIDGRDRPVVVARAGAPAEAPLLALGHFDTVLDAIPPRREGDRLIATGAIDMKGGWAALLAALDLVARRGGSPPADLLVVGVPDEEIGGPIAQQAARRWGTTARALWVLEPGESAADGAETLVAGRRGLVSWRLAVRGRAAHSGLAFWQGRSAAAAAASWAARAAALSRRGAGPTVNIARLLAGGADLLARPVDHAELFGSFRQLNVVADAALIEGEARFLTAAGARAIVVALRDLAAAVAAECDLEIDFEIDQTIPPVDPRSPHRATLERAVELARRRGWRLELEEERGGVSFPNFLPDPSRLPILDGLGPVGGGMHTREEWVDLRSLRRRVVLVADLLGEAASGSATGGTP